MKKILLPLAVLAAMSAASAEVKVSGKVEAVLGGTTSEALKDNAEQSLGFTGGKADFYLDGGEVVAEGVEALYHIGVNAGSTAQDKDGTNVTLKKAYMGFKGSFGTVTLGLQGAVDGDANFLQADENAIFVSSKKNAAGTTVYGSKGTMERSIKYSNSFDAVTVNAIVGMPYGAKKGAVVKTSEAQFGVSAVYAQDAISAGVAFQQDSGLARVDVDKVKTGSKLTVGGSYDAGVAKVGLNYVAMNFQGADAKKNPTQIAFGVSAPIDAASSVALDLGMGLTKDVNEKHMIVDAKYSNSLTENTSISALVSYDKPQDENKDAVTNYSVTVSHSF